MKNNKIYSKSKNVMYITSKISFIDKLYIICINHDIVIGLCSDIHTRLSYYIRPGYGKNIFGLKWESKPCRRERETSTLPLDQSANSSIVLYT